MHGGKQQRDQKADQRDHDQKFDERKTAAVFHDEPKAAERQAATGDSVQIEQSAPTSGGGGSTRRR
jgi:hypothetical protein